MWCLSLQYYMVGPPGPLTPESSSQILLTSRLISLPSPQNNLSCLNTRCSHTLPSKNDNWWHIGKSMSSGRHLVSRRNTSMLGHGKINQTASVILQFTHDFKTVIHVTLIKWEGNAEWLDAVGNAFRNVRIRI
jgi:hypothetical protein